jgi:16S rRNA (cytosine967-C5)-methyltransferase
MPAPQLQSARAVAAETLQRVDPARDYAGTILDRLLSQTDERQRATDLVYGTIRNLLALDAMIARFAGRRPDRIAPSLLSIIRVGIYELVYSPATPVYSIVNEAVTNAHKAGGKKQTGFVNAVLREVVRHIVNREAPLAASNPRRTLVRELDAGCEFDTDFLPDPADSLAEHLSTCFSLPLWLVRDWLDAFGPDQTRQICLGSNRRPSLYIRVNLLRTTAQDLLSRFEQAGIGVGWAVPTDSHAYERQMVGTAHPTDPDMLRVTSPHSVTELPGFSEGLFVVQDLSASQAVKLLQPQPGWTILDLCSAPGTKTTQIAEMTRDSAAILATDINPERLERVPENIARLGLKSITIIPYAQLEQGTIGPFDAILLDVPCSNTGVLARRIEARYRLRPESISDLAATQRALLEKAATLLKPSGRLCYSTCSIQKTENQEVVQAFLKTHNEFQLAQEHVILPSAPPFDHDGAYTAVLQIRKCNG